jgi:hypothetical protein
MGKIFKKYKLVNSVTLIFHEWHTDMSYFLLDFSTIILQLIATARGVAPSSGKKYALFWHSTSWAALWAIFS